MNLKMKPQKNRWWQAIKIILGLIILSFILSVIISLFIEDDFDGMDGNVAVIGITGTILAEEDTNFILEDVSSSDDIRRLIRKADRNDDIKAIVFKINSPGGSAVASDHVIANRMSITGSIGVIASYLGFSGFISDHNVTYERLVSGNLKDMGSPFKEMTQEERVLFQKSLDKIHEYFVEEVAKNRNLKKRDVEKVATGQFFIGAEAKELGLVDELGGREEVIAYVKGKIGEDADFVSYETEKGFFESFGKIFNENSFYIGKGIGNSMFTKAELKDGLSIST